MNVVLMRLKPDWASSRGEDAHAKRAWPRLRRVAQDSQRRRSPWSATTKRRRRSPRVRRQQRRI